MLQKIFLVLHITIRVKVQNFKNSKISPSWTSHELALAFDRPSANPPWPGSFAALT